MRRARGRDTMISLEVAGGEAMARQFEELHRRLELATLRCGEELFDAARRMSTRGVEGSREVTDVVTGERPTTVTWIAGQLTSVAFLEALGMPTDVAAPNLNCRCAHRLPTSTGRLRASFSGGQADQEVTTNSNQRAEDLLARFLTEGEQAALERLGVIPALGGTTGDLYLVRRALAYNLLRYTPETVPRRWLRFLPPKTAPIPRMGCVTRAQPAPLADLLLSILIGIRYAEKEIVGTAIWWYYRTLKISDTERYFTGALEIALEPFLRQLAECRCEDPDLLDLVAHAAEAGGGLV